MSDNGWIKLYRKSIENGWLKNKNVWLFWTYCLLKASHKKYKTMVGYQQITLNPGQFVFGLKKAAKETRLSIQQIRTCLANLKEWQNLTIKTTNKFSIITICNWEIYQGDELDIQHANQQTTNKQLTTNKNVKNNIYIVQQIISYLNEKTEKNYTTKNEQTNRMINARLNDGYTLDDFKKVIDNKCHEWNGNGDFEKFLRPSTLFRPSHFDEYLNQTPPKKKNGGLVL